MSSVRDDIRAGLSADGEFDTSVEPVAVQRLGAAAAQTVSDHAVAAVVCWSGDDDAVFAQVLAAELRVRVLRAHESLGLLSLDANLPPGTRVALVATRWSESRLLDPLEGLVQTEGLHPVIALSVLRGGPASRSGLPSIVLEDL
ncbi:hypothetical protein [Jiangella asiatica]|uniref:Uncharacterized protein n=1 Tax=Jiangella asiatica TaxID=2530372 RepID=A0A4R5DQ74_9ACTN|nr:hypothetical protein [Jiangella asiatica]TDE14374.1 hypothetical protein E1269_04255 [Jiangella asiatica]